jgi:Trk K+ transport system NAD-binding subunit
VFHLGTRTHGVADALYRTISLIATGADMRGDRFHDELKVYVSILRIVGAALTAAFTAIVTNYLLRASLGGALEVGRIPDGGHVIVCGLGDIGYRVVRELTDEGQRVVVVEVSRDNRFVSTVRRLGVPVILGDAAVHEVLRQAHGSTARAVIACTSSDLINLEVALLAREVDPHKRVVLLQSDPQLADMLRQAANVRLAVSVPALAAPAFVAGLFGDRVQSVFRLGARLLAVLDVLVQSREDWLAGQSVRALAVDYRLLPVAVRPAVGGPARHPMNARLEPGDRLLAIVALEDLDPLLHRRPPPADLAVDVTDFPSGAREWLALLVGTVRGTEREAADKALDQLPLTLGDRLTRGQAEDLLALLLREQISARLRAGGA